MRTYVVLLLLRHHNAATMTSNDDGDDGCYCLTSRIVNDNEIHGRELIACGMIIYINMYDVGIYNMIERERDREKALNTEHIRHSIEP